VKATTKDIERDVDNLTRELNELKYNRNTKKISLTQADNLYSSLGFYDLQYQGNETDLKDLKRKRKIMSTYKNAPTRSEFFLQELKEDLIIEAENLKNEELEQLIENVKTEKADSIITLTNAVIDIWFSKDDKQNYIQYRDEDNIFTKQSIRNDYLVSEIDFTSKSMQEETNSLEKNKKEILIRFFDTIFFLEDTGILTIDKTDIFQFGLVVPPGQEREIVRKTYSVKLALDLYIKYGGKTLKPDPSEPSFDVDIRDLYTTEFSLIKEEISNLLFELEEKAPILTPIEEVTRKTLKNPSYGGPYLNEINFFRAWLFIQTSKLEEDIEKVEDHLESSRDRLSRIRRGEITFKDIEQPYRHRRQWVERPEHSGIVRIKPIVVTAIDDAFKMIQLWTEYGKKVNVEFMQYDEEIRTDFAKLVAIKMSFSIMRFPKQYLSTTLRTFSKQDEYDIVNRFKNSYKIIIDQEKSTFG
ncbi:hypothetical protein LCGC14_2584610, partial [marine sediment metagenome]